MVNELNTTKGTNKKIEVMKKYADIKNVIKMTNDSQIKTRITGPGWDKFVTNKAANAASILGKANKSEYLSGDQDLFSLFNDITSGNLKGDAAKAAVYMFMQVYDTKYHETIKSIFVKNIRIRMGAETIQKAFPGMFDLYKVILAKGYDEKVFDKAFTSTKKYITKYYKDDVANIPVAYISKKEDGIRLNVHVDAKTVVSKSRSNKIFRSLDVFKKDFAKIYQNAKLEDRLKNGLVFDGEVMAAAADDIGRKEAFRDTQSSIMGHDDVKNPTFWIFDVLTKDEFSGAKASLPYGERYKLLRSLIPEDHPRLKVLDHVEYDTKTFEKMKKTAIASEWEGLMIRFNYKYERKRTYKLLKYKIFQKEEYKVHDVVIKKMPFPLDGGGEVMKTALHSIIILHKNNKVAVGSGFGFDERIEYAKHPEKIKGKLVFIKYQDETENTDKKTYSLRLPIYKGMVAGEDGTKRIL